MEFIFAPEQREFRLGLRKFLASDEIRGAIGDLAAVEGESDPRPLLRLIGAAGMLAVDWPARYGGRDLGIVEAGILCEELIAAGVPDTMFVNSVQIVGLFVLLAGTEEQKQRLLPPLAAGELFASVLYTEPHAGSDLGALETRAEPRPGGGFRLTGVKRFSLKSHLADVGLVAVRTATDGSRYEGITMVLVDLHAPGVEVVPVPSMATERFNEVRFDGAEVTDADVVGKVGQGWPLLLQGLAIERTGMDYSAKARRWLAASDAEPDADLARAWSRVERGRLLAYRVIGALAEGRVDETAAAMAKWFTGEVAGEIADQRLRRGESLAGARLLDEAYRDAPGQRLSAGTSEVMLGVVAGRLAEVVG